MVEDEVVFERGAEVGVAAGGFDVEGFGGGGVDGEVEGHGEAEGVEAGAEVGGGGGEAEVERALRCGIGVCHAGCGQLHVGFEGAQDDVGVGFEDDGGLAQGGVEGLIGGAESGRSRLR